MASHVIQGRKDLEDTVSVHPNGRQVQTGLVTGVSPVQILTARQSLPECRRLIVLVPNSEMTQGARLPQRIWQLAVPGKVPVLYLAIAGDYDSEMSARRQLTLLAAVTRDKRVPVEIQIAHTPNWVEALRPIVQPGDAVLSYSGQIVRKGLFASEALSDQLGRCLTVPVYLLSGYEQDKSKKFSTFPRLMLSGAVLGLILAGFFALDAQVIHQLRGTLQQVMLLLLILIEIGAIWVWNGWVG